MNGDLVVYRFAVAIAATALSLAAFAQTSNDVRVSGVLSVRDSAGGSFQVTFSCTGIPTCTGIYNITLRDTGCSNSFSFDDSLVVTGFDLSRHGTFQGTVAPASGSSSTRNPDGTCTYFKRPQTKTFPYAASWDGTNGVITVIGESGDGQQFPVPGTFTASIPSAPPVFPMTIASNITVTTSTASAQIQPRAQDVGTTASVFVFAHAPASVLRKSFGKQVIGPSIPAESQDGDFCVLAQLDASGQLTAVSASTMQAYTTSVLTSQSQAVGILNNVATSSVAGATFYVGYGASAAAMLANGVYQNALSIPGSSQCTASLAAAPAPSSPGGLSGLWWNPNESGWGIHFTQRRNILFAAWYTYDSLGNPKWYVASSCSLPTGVTGTSGTCNGTLYDVNGPTFFGTAFNPALVNVAPTGNLQVNFQNANGATMTYTVTGQTRTVALQRQVFATGTTSPAVDYTDLWWNPDESGWGMAIAHQYGVMFLAWYVYDNNGKPVWYVASNCVVNGSSCSGTLYRTTGPAFGPTFDSSRIQVFTAGTASMNFTDANSGLLSYTANGVSATKTIRRQTF